MICGEQMVTSGKAEQARRMLGLPFVGGYLVFSHKGQSASATRRSSAASCLESQS